MNLKPEILTEIDQVIARYPNKRSAALPLLHLIQDDQGHISKAAIEWIAEKLNLEPINIYELVTFYPMLREEPIGRKHIKICRTLSCALMGGYKVCRRLEEKLNCLEGENSEDGDYRIEFVECLASCGTGPVVMVNDKLYENVNPERIDDFLSEIEKLNPETVS